MPEIKLKERFHYIYEQYATPVEQALSFQDAKVTSIQDEGDRFVNKNVLAFGDEAEAGVPEIAVEKNELSNTTNGAENVEDDLNIQESLSYVLTLC